MVENKLPVFPEKVSPRSLTTATCSKVGQFLGFLFKFTLLAFFQRPRWLIPL
jgi:hypothetical protein